MANIKWQCPSDPPLDPSYQTVMDKLWSEIGITASNAGDLTSLAYWTFAECKLIALGIAPNLLGKRILKRVLTVLKLERSYNKLHEPFKRAFQAGELGDQMKPRYFVKWAKKSRIAIPEPILSAIFNAEKETQSPQKNNTSDSLESSAKSNKSAQTRTEITLYKLIYSMAKSKYRFDQQGLNRNVAAAILSDLNLLGLEMSENTIRTHLQKSKEICDAQK